MHTAQSRIDDEIDFFADINPPRLRVWCDECGKPTTYRFDAFGLPMCLECEDETQHA